MAKFVHKNIVLYNHSRLSSDILLLILQEAYDAANIKGRIVVVFTKGFVGHGIFYHGKSFLIKKYFKHRRHVSSDAGLIVVHPRLRKFETNSIACAERTCNIILHEFKHASDYVQKIPFTYDKPYRQRPHEIRARFFADHEAKISKELIAMLSNNILKG